MKVPEGHHEGKGWEHLRLDSIAWEECLTQAQVRHARGALLSRDDEADTLPAEPEVTIDDHVDDGEEEVEEVPADAIQAGEVDWTEPALPADAEPVKKSPGSWH
eukprot:4572086-Amphidinium_carterae.2